MTDVMQILDQQERAIEALFRTTKAAIDVARVQVRELEAKAGPDDEWTRMPGKGQRCRISNWSRSKLNHLITAGDVRKKKHVGSVFYAGADVRKLLNS